MPMTCSSMPSAVAFTSVAGLAFLMFLRRTKQLIDESPAFRRFQVHALRYLCPRWIVCLLLSGRVPESQQPSGCSDQCLESIVATLRTNACLRAGRVRNGHFRTGLCRDQSSPCVWSPQIVRHHVVKSLFLLASAPLSALPIRLSGR